MDPSWDWLGQILSSHYCAKQRTGDVVALSDEDAEADNTGIFAGRKKAF